MKNVFLKLLVTITLIASVCVFASCSSTEDHTEKKGEISYTSDGIPEFKSPLAPSSEDKHIEPDLSKVKPKKASKSVMDTSTEEKFVEALESFANPNGNKYDAMAILGSYSYTDDEDALYKRFETASKSWHDLIESMVGEKCVVDIELQSKGDIASTEEKFTDWQRVYGGVGEDYTNIKCVIKSNYSTSSVTYSIDIVKVDGKWHLANAGTLDKIQAILIDELFR